MSPGNRRRFLKQMLGLALAATTGPLQAGRLGIAAIQRGAAPTRLLLAGDVMTGRGIDHILPHAGHPRLHEPFHWHARAYVRLAETRNGPIPPAVNYDYPWGDALAVLDEFQPAARIVNLETTVTTADTHWPDKPVHFRMHPGNMPCLTAAGLDCCALANNHILDWGQAGLDETLSHLHTAGIHTAGAGRDLQQAAAAAIIELDADRRILVFGFGHPSSGIPGDWRATANRGGINLLEDLSVSTVNRIALQVQALRQPGDIVIASIHWGGNWGYSIPAEQRRFAHALVDSANIDIVHGHSSHHPKGIEIYNGKPIFYGCGDLINDYEGIAGNEQYRGDLILMHFPVMDAGTGQLLQLDLVPMRIKRFRLQHASNEESGWLLDMLNREGKAFGTRAEPAADHTIRIRWAE